MVASLHGNWHQARHQSLKTFDLKGRFTPGLSHPASYRQDRRERKCGRKIFIYLIRIYRNRPPSAKRTKRDNPGRFWAFRGRKSCTEVARSLHEPRKNSYAICAFPLAFCAQIAYPNPARQFRQRHPPEGGAFPCTKCASFLLASTPMVPNVELFRWCRDHASGLARAAADAEKFGMAFARFEARAVGK